MKLTRMPAVMYGVSADNGDPLLLYGACEGFLMIWPTPHIAKHKLAFARWSKRELLPWARHLRIMWNHPLCEATKRWATWCGVTLEQGEVV